MSRHIFHHLINIYLNNGGLQMSMFLDRFNNLVKLKGITINQALIDIGLNTSSFVNWKQRGTVPSGETLIKIADYFKVSVDYLLGQSDNPGLLESPDFWNELVKKRIQDEELIASLGKSVELLEYFKSSEHIAMVNKYLEAMNAIPESERQSLFDYLDFLRNKYNKS
jgi:transcriptional regulator with XRE-family HTH domain